MLSRLFVCLLTVTALCGSGHAQEAVFKKGATVDLKDQELLTKCGEGTVLGPAGGDQVWVDFANNHACPRKAVAKGDLDLPFANKPAAKSVVKAWAQRPPRVVAAPHAVLIEVEFGGRSKFTMDELKGMINAIHNKASDFQIDIVASLDANPPKGSLNDPGPANSYVVQGFSSRTPEEQQAVLDDLSKVVDLDQKTAQAKDTGLPPPPNAPELSPYDQSYASAMGLFDTELDAFVARNSKIAHTVFMVSGGKTNTAGDEAVRALKRKFDLTEVVPINVPRQSRTQVLLAFAEIAGRARLSVDNFRTQINGIMQNAPAETVDIAVALNGSAVGSLTETGLPQNGYYIAGLNTLSANDQSKVWDDLSKLVATYESNPINLPSDAHISSQQIFKAAMLHFSNKYPSLKHVAAREVPADRGITALEINANEAEVREVARINDIEIRSEGLETSRRPIGQAILVAAELAGGTSLSVSAVKQAVDDYIKDMPEQAVDIIVALDGPAPSFSKGEKGSPSNGYLITGLNKLSETQRDEIWKNLASVVYALRDNAHLMTATNRQYPHDKYYQPIDVEAAVKKVGSNEDSYDNVMGVFDPAIRAFANRYPNWKHIVDMKTGGPAVTQHRLELRQNPTDSAEKMRKDLTMFAFSHDIEIHVAQAPRDVLVQVRTVAYPGLLESSVRLPKSGDGLREMAAMTGGTFSLLVPGNSNPILESAQVPGYDAQAWAGRLLTYHFNPSELNSVVQGWGPTNNTSQDALRAMAGITKNMIGVIKMEPDNAPLEMGSAKVAAWVSQNVPRIVQMPSAPGSNDIGAAQVAAWVDQALAKRLTIGSGTVLEGLGARSVTTPTEPIADPAADSSDPQQK